MRSPLRFRLRAALAAIAVAGALLPAHGAGAKDRMPPEVVVRYRSGVDGAERGEIRGRAQAVLARKVKGIPRAEVLSPEPGETTESLLEELNAHPDVLYAEPNRRYRIALTPNDTSYSTLWGLHNTGQSGGTADADIDAPEAWEATTGSSDVVVAVVDTGADLDHPDLAANLVPGLEFLGTDGDAPPEDGNDHGTHVAGTIGAVGNNGVGVTGVAWDVSIMPLQALDSSGSGYVADVAQAFAYAGDQGVAVVNASLGGGYSQLISDAITGAPDTLFVVAAGNNGTNNDSSPMYPCNLSMANLVCVAATDRDDARSWFSNYGATSVDLGAPGEAIRSTVPGGYDTFDGTSMATPHVAGVAALLWSVLPSATVAEVKAALLASVDPISALSGRTVSGGRLNAAAAVALATGEPPPPAAGLSPDATVQRAKGFTVSWGSNTIFSSGLQYDVRYRQALLRQDFGAAQPWLTATGTTSSAFTGAPGSSYCFSATVSGQDDWGSERCTAVPLNDRSLSRRGRWASRSSSSYYLGTASKSKKRGSTLAVRDVRAQRLALVASRCPRCGTVKVLWNGVTLRKISLKASTTVRKRVLWIETFPTPRTGTVVIKVVSRGKPVLIEGLAIGVS